MGQEQSQGPKESQSDPEEPSQPDTMNESPQPGRRTSPKSADTERKSQRGLWPDGGWIGSRTGIPQHGPEMVAKTVWYQDENIDQGISEDWNRKDSRSVWYDSDTKDQRKHEQLEQGMSKQKECDLSSPQASGLSSPQLLEQGFSSHQLSAALSQPHAAGTQPALSHGPGAQRREVHRSQREEEVGPDWKEGGVKGDGEEVSNRETTYSRKSSETADIEEGGEEKQGSEEKGAKARKKRRKKRGKRGGTEAKLSSSSSIESQSQIEIQTQREQVTNLSTQSETASEAKDKTGRADIQSPRVSEPTRQEEADKDAMHLPSQTEGQTRDCDVTNSDPSYTTPEFSPTDHGRTDLTQVTASQTLQTKELSEGESMNFHGPDDFNLHFTVRQADTEEITVVQPLGMEVFDATEVELKGIASPVQQTMDNIESKALSENEDLKVAVASMDGTGLVESNCPKELPVKHSDPTEFTEDSFLVEFPEQNTQHVQSVYSEKPVKPMEPMGRHIGFMESVHPTEAGCLPFEGRADVSPLQKGEGRAETTQREYLEHCLASEMLRDQRLKEEKRNKLWVGEEEAGEERSWERRGEENDTGMVHCKELSSIDREQEQNYSEDLVATAVAVVTVAIASALASIELSQQLADNRSEGQESASKEPANDPPLAEEPNVPTDTLNQLADSLLNTVQSAQLSAQPMNKEDCQLLGMTPTETENQLIEPTDLFTCTALDNGKISQELQCNTEAEKLPAPELRSVQQVNLGLSAVADSPSLPQLEKEEIQTENTQNSLSFLCSLPKAEDSLLHVNMKPLPEANEMMTSKVDSQGRMQIEIQMQEESQLPCPARDTGQHPRALDTLSPGSEENPTLGERRQPRDQSICWVGSGIQADSNRQQFDSSSQHNQTHDADDSHRVEFTTAEGKVERQAHEQCKAEERESCEEEFLDSECQAMEHESTRQLDGQVETPCDGDIPTLPFSCGLTLPVIPYDSTSTAGPSPDEPSAPVNVETGEYQSSQSSEDTGVLPGIPPDAGSGTFRSKSQESVAMDNEDGVFKVAQGSDTLDTVDGWKERERKKVKSDEEARTEMVTVEDTSQTGN